MRPGARAGASASRWRRSVATSRRHNDDHNTGTACSSTGSSTCSGHGGGRRGGARVGRRTLRLGCAQQTATVDLRLQTNHNVIKSLFRSKVAPCAWRCNRRVTPGSTSQTRSTAARTRSATTCQRCLQQQESARVKPGALMNWRECTVQLQSHQQRKDDERFHEAAEPAHITPPISKRHKWYGTKDSRHDGVGVDAASAHAGANDDRRQQRDCKASA